MNIEAIEHYTREINEVREILGLPRLSLMRGPDRQQIADRISQDLSPEVLSCDGELDREEIAARYKYLSRVATELLSIDPDVTFEE
jgi:hypothetical protein